MRKTIMLLALISWGLAANAQSSAREILDAMCDAMQNESYHGTFVYLHDNKMETMEIVRRKNQQGEIEKILSLNGEAREIIRDKDAVTCILPGSKKVTVDKSRPRSQLPLALPQNLDGIENFYVLSIEGEERVAGRDCYVVGLMPKDSYRYGHRMWVDKSSSIMVKSDLLDEQGMPVEQIMFTSLKVTDNLPDDMFKPTLKDAGFNVIEVGKGDMEKPQKMELEWQATQVPNGFSLISHDRQKSMASSDPMEHMVLSDGLASVSVFVEPYKKGSRALKGGSRMGAVNAYGRVDDGYKIMVVGEVPAATVRLINKSIEKAR